MNPDEFLLEKPSPGSNTCILIGRLPEGMLPPVESCRAVLWVVDQAGAAHPAGRLPAGAVSVLLVDHGTAEQMENAVNQFLVNSPKRLPSLYVTRRIPPEHESRFGTAMDIVFACVESHQRARVTRQQDAFAWQSYLFENSHAYMTRRVPDRWQGALAGVPALVCGAGPSLDVSARALVRAAHEGVVLAADSSLKALSKLGVQADFAVSVDVAKVPSKCLPETLAPGRVVLSATSPPQWSGAVAAARRFYLSSSQLTLDWLAAQGVSRTEVAVCENCGATAIELARFLGCSPICLFGMDLAFNSEGPVRRHHESVDASVYANSGFNARQQFPRAPGNFAPAVPTHVIGDWRAFGPSNCRMASGAGLGRHRPGRQAQEHDCLATGTIRLAGRGVEEGRAVDRAGRASGSAGGVGPRCVGQANPLWQLPGAMGAFPAERAGDRRARLPR